MCKITGVIVMGLKLIYHLLCALDRDNNIEVRIYIEVDLLSIVACEQTHYLLQAFKIHILHAY